MVTMAIQEFLVHKTIFVFFQGRVHFEVLNNATNCSVVSSY